MGLTVFSNKSICISKGSNNFLGFFISENTALLACSAMCFLAETNAPLWLKYIPRYLYSFIISISAPFNVNFVVGFGRPRLLNIIIFVFAARWLSGRVSDSGAWGRGFDTYRRRVVSLSKTLYSPKVLVNYPGSGGSVPTWLKNCWLGR